MLQDKKSIRKEILSKRGALKAETLLDAGLTALKDISSLDQYQNAKTLMVYMDFRGEVPTDILIAHALSLGKKLVLPLTDKDFNIIPYEVVPKDDSIEDSLSLSSFGILEPNPKVCKLADPSTIDMVIVPGVAFDLTGNRLGYGKGCYDRFLPKLRPEVFKLGLAHQVQLVRELPTDDTDIRMDAITIV